MKFASYLILLPGSDFTAWRCAARLLAACRHESVLAFVVLAAISAMTISPGFAASPTSLMKKPAAESPAEKAKPPPLTVEQLRERLNEAQKVLNAVESKGRLSISAPPGTPEAELQLRVRMLRLQVYAYGQHIAALGNLAEQKKLADEEAAKRRAWKGFVEKPPYSILMIDNMRAELQASQLELRSEEARTKIVAAQIENNKEALEKSRERYRRRQEELESAKPSEMTIATWRRDLALLEERALTITIEWLSVQRELVEAYLSEARQVADFVQRKISEVEKSAVFRQADLDRLKASIEERRSEVVKEMERLTAERDRLAADVVRSGERATATTKSVTKLERAWTEAKSALSAANAALAKAENPEGFLRKLNPLRGRSERAEVDTRKVEVAVLEKQYTGARAMIIVHDRERSLAVERSRNAATAVETSGVRLVALDTQRAFWELRFSAMSSESAGVHDQRKIQKGARKLLEILNPAVDHLRSKLEAIVSELNEQQGRLRVAVDSGESAYRKEMLELITARERLYLNAFANIEEPRQMLLRVTGQTLEGSEALTVSEHAQGWLGATGEWLGIAWSYELFTVEDSIVVDGKTITGSRGITVAKIVQAILITVLGYFLAAYVTRKLFDHAARRLDIDPTSARIARKWVLALLVIFLLLISLNIVKIPFTAFAFLGGAVAIAVGFGMQTVLKNLISGVMLLLERPFRPRDIVEVGGIRGEVTDINVRSCTIRDASGIETLVPNSTFLEQNVTNWTLSSRQVRYSLKIGVAYGSPARKVADLLLEVADRHDCVLKDPKPEVLFVDFGDNALMFTLNVWLEIGPGRTAGTVVLSDMRFMIDECFTEHSISIPFPQRDVRVDASVPLPVRVVVDAIKE